jgi:hypothetical protein
MPTKLVVKVSKLHNSPVKLSGHHVQVANPAVLVEEMRLDIGRLRSNTENLTGLQIRYHAVTVTSTPVR